MVTATETESVGKTEWAITDEPDRLRVFAESTAYQLPSPHATDATATIGSSSDCWLQLRDPKNKISRSHATLLRHGGRWKLADLGSKNGLSLDGARRSSIYLTPGAEIGIGSIVLIVESPLLVKLRELLARLIGWSPERQVDVDNALRAVRVAAARRESLLLCGDEGLFAIARLLHNRALGEDRPFVVCNPHRRRAESDARAAVNYDDGMVALQEAAGGTICIRRERPLPGFDQVVAAVRRPPARAQLIVCTQRPPEPNQPTMGPTIVIPPLSERRSEVPRIVEEFGRDDAAALGGGSLTPENQAWIVRYESSSLGRISTASRRLVAYNRADRNATQAASLLGMSKSSLLEWFAVRPSAY